VYNSYNDLYVKNIYGWDFFAMKEFIETTLSIDALQLPARFSKDSVENIFIPLLHHLTALQKEKGRRIVVFLGAPIGSGKSMLLAFLEKLSRELEGVEPIQALGLDGFHFPNEYLLSHEMEVDGQMQVMRTVKGWVETFNVEKLYEKLVAIQAGENVWCPAYDRKLHDPVDDMIHIDANIIMVEGLWMLYGQNRWADVQALADYRIALMSKVENLRARAIARKIRNGMTPEAAAEFFDRSDLAATARIIRTMGPAQMYLESFPDNDIIAHEKKPENMEPYYVYKKQS